MLRPSDGKLVIRDGSIFVLSHLEAGGIDYAFEYRSVAEGHDLRWVSLPPEIDLSSTDYADEYRTVRVILGFQRFSARLARTGPGNRLSMQSLYRIMHQIKSLHRSLQIWLS